MRTTAASRCCSIVVDDRLRPSLKGAPGKTFASTYLNVHLIAEERCGPAVPDEFEIRANGCFLEAQSCETITKLGHRSVKLGPFEFDIFAGANAGTFRLQPELKAKLAGSSRSGPHAASTPHTRLTSREK